MAKKGALFSQFERELAELNSARDYFDIFYHQETPVEEIPRRQRDKWHDGYEVKDSRSKHVLHATDALIIDGFSVLFSPRSNYDFSTAVAPDFVKEARLSEIKGGDPSSIRITPMALSTGLINILRSQFGIRPKLSSAIVVFDKVSEVSVAKMWEWFERSDDASKTREALVRGGHLADSTVGNGGFGGTDYYAAISDHEHRDGLIRLICRLAVQSLSDAMEPPLSERKHSVAFDFNNGSGRNPLWLEFDPLFGYEIVAKEEIGRRSECLGEGDDVFAMYAELFMLQRGRFDRGEPTVEIITNDADSIVSSLVTAHSTFESETKWRLYLRQFGGGARHRLRNVTSMYEKLIGVADPTTRMIDFTDLLVQIVLSTGNDYVSASADDSLSRLREMWGEVRSGVGEEFDASVYLSRRSPFVIDYRRGIVKANVVRLLGLMLYVWRKRGDRKLSFAQTSLPRTEAEAIRLAERRGARTGKSLIKDWLALQMRLPLLMFTDDMKHFAESDLEGTNSPEVIRLMLPFLRRVENDPSIELPSRRLEELSESQVGERERVNSWSKRLVQYWLLSSNVHGEKIEDLDDFESIVSLRLVHETEKADLADLVGLLKRFYDASFASSLFDFLKGLAGGTYDLSRRTLKKLIAPYIKKYRVELEKLGEDTFGGVGVDGRDFSATFVLSVTRRADLVGSSVLGATGGYDMRAIGKDRGRIRLLGQSARAWWNLMNALRGHEWTFVCEQRRMLSNEDASALWGYGSNGYSASDPKLEVLSEHLDRLESDRLRVRAEEFSIAAISKMLVENPATVSPDPNVSDVGEYSEAALRWRYVPGGYFDARRRSTFAKYIDDLRPQNTRMKQGFYATEEEVERRDGTLKELEFDVGSYVCTEQTADAAQVIAGRTEFAELMEYAISYSSRDGRSYLHPDSENPTSLESEVVSRIIAIVSVAFARSSAPTDGSADIGGISPAILSRFFLTCMRLKFSLKTRTVWQEIVIDALSIIAGDEGFVKGELDSWDNGVGRRIGLQSRDATTLLASWMKVLKSFEISAGFDVFATTFESLASFLVFLERNDEVLVPFAFDPIFAKAGAVTFRLRRAKEIELFPYGPTAMLDDATGRVKVTEDRYIVKGKIAPSGESGEPSELVYAMDEIDGLYYLALSWPESALPAFECEAAIWWLNHSHEYAHELKWSQGDWILRFLKLLGMPNEVDSAGAEIAAYKRWIVSHAKLVKLDPDAAFHPIPSDPMTNLELYKELAPAPPDKIEEILIDMLGTGAVAPVWKWMFSQDSTQIVVRRKQRVTIERDTGRLETFVPWVFDPRDHISFLGALDDRAFRRRLERFEIEGLKDVRVSYATGEKIVLGASGFRLPGIRFTMGKLERFELDEETGDWTGDQEDHDILVSIIASADGVGDWTRIRLERLLDFVLENVDGLAPEDMKPDSSIDIDGKLVTFATSFLGALAFAPGQFSSAEKNGITVSLERAVDRKQPIELKGLITPMNELSERPKNGRNEMNTGVVNFTIEYLDRFREAANGIIAGRLSGGPNSLRSRIDSERLRAWITSVFFEFDKFYDPPTSSLRFSSEDVLTFAADIRKAMRSAKSSSSGVAIDWSVGTPSDHASVIEQYSSTEGFLRVEHRLKMPKGIERAFNRTQRGLALYRSTFDSVAFGKELREIFGGARSHLLWAALDFFERGRWMVRDQAFVMLNEYTDEVVGRFDVPGVWANRRNVDATYPLSSEGFDELAEELEQHPPGFLGELSSAYDDDTKRRIEMQLDLSDVLLEMYKDNETLDLGPSKKKRAVEALYEKMGGIWRSWGAEKSIAVSSAFKERLYRCRLDLTLTAVDVRRELYFRGGSKKLETPKYLTSRYSIVAGNLTEWIASFVDASLLAHINSLDPDNPRLPKRAGLMPSSRSFLAERYAAVTDRTPELKKFLEDLDPYLSIVGVSEDKISLEWLADKMATILNVNLEIFSVGIAKDGMITLFEHISYRKTQEEIIDFGVIRFVSRRGGTIVWHFEPVVSGPSVSSSPPQP